MKVFELKVKLSVLLNIWGSKYMKLKQIKIYSFGRSCISDGIISSENLEDNTITLTESFLTIALECYKNQKIENGQLIEEIIKVMLPISEEKAKEEWENGLTFNGNKYFAWFATTGGMKAEKNYGKCETIFIREDFLKFSGEFEELISLGKFKEIEDSKAEICINKDILSRLSLCICQLKNRPKDHRILGHFSANIVPLEFIFRGTCFVY